ncbi:MATE family efflux transporter [Clostridium sp. MCC353]|uniref:MATE family efflux transporter n=1 Tax=Clostridium sp. MCC353 TaxID=2592646 RepID=UPI001C01288C|nr:MATE family efflux transporter [Clostridium sp. MCC353]MBT9779884.1 MATE family efflux transporter [Clostridium sp. MCC353]
MENKNLTSGNIRKQLAALTLPLLAGSILQQFYNTVDALILGRYAGMDAFGAAGVAGTVMNLFIFILSGSCSGMTILFAQFYGRRAMDQFRREVFLTLVWGGMFTLAISLAAIFSAVPLLKLIHTPAAVLPHAGNYLCIIFAGLPVTYLYNLFSSILRSAGNTKAALLFLAAAVFANIIFDLIFIAGAGMGTKGAALATVAAQLISVLLCVIYIKKCYPELLFTKNDMHCDKAMAGRTLSFSFASALHQSSLYIGKMMVQGSVNSLGADAVCAYTAASRIEGFANSFGDSGSQALSVFTAQNTGAGKMKRVRAGLKNGFILLSCLGLFLSLVMYAGARPFTALLTGNNQPSPLTSGTAYLRVISVFYPLCFIGNAFVGYFRGTGRVNIPVIGTTLHISIRVLLSCLLAPSLGLPAISLATGAGWAAVVTFFILLARCHKNTTQK